VGADEPELKKVYHTGSSGYQGSVVLGLLALAIITFTIATGHFSRWIGEAMAEGSWPKLLMLAACLVIDLGILSLAVYGVMQCRNASVTVSEHGLTITNWRKRTKVIQWQDVVGVGYGETFGSALWLELVYGDGTVRQQIIAHSLTKSESIKELREEIVSRLGLTAVPELDKGFHAKDQRIWR